MPPTRATNICLGLCTGGLLVCLGAVVSTDAVSAEAEVSEVAPPDIPADDTVSDDMKPKLAIQHISQMQRALKRLLALLEEARETRDVVKLNCVNAKLTQAKGLVRISEQAELAMLENLAKGNGELSNNEYAKVALGRKQCRILLADAEACIGELAMYFSETVVVVDGEDRDLQDPVQSSTPAPIVERPEQVSLYQ